MSRTPFALYPMNEPFRFFHQNFSTEKQCAVASLSHWLSPIYCIVTGVTGYYRSHESHFRISEFAFFFCIISCTTFLVLEQLISVQTPKRLSIKFHSNSVGCAVYAHR